MTRVLFYTIATLTLFVMLLIGNVFRKRDTLQKRKLINLFCGAAATLIIYCFSLINVGPKLSVLTNGLYYISVHALLIFLADFLLVFTEKDLHSAVVLRFKKIWAILFITDFLFIIVNVFTKQLFSINPVFVRDNFFCWHVDFHPLFSIHLCLCYFLTLLNAILLFIKVIDINRFYRGKYIIMLVFFCIVVLVNAVFLMFDLNLNISTLLYSVFCGMAAYYTYYTIPKKVETRMLMLVSQHLSSGILCFNAEKKCIFRNPEAKRIFPVLEEAEQELNSIIEKKRELFSTKIEIGEGKDKKIISEEFHIVKDNNNVCLGYLIQLDDITSEENSLNIERFNSTHDPLTGLWNRGSFIQEAGKTIMKHPDDSWYMVCTDIENFKFINDLFGISFGDLLLMAQAKMLKRAQYEDTVIGRISGDKFAMLIRKRNFNQEKAIENTLQICNLANQYNYKLKFDIGVFEISDPYENVNSMCDKAQLAINNNKNYEQIISYYSTSLMDSIQEEKIVLGAFESALKENQFKMFLQPQVESRSNKVVGAEALVRWIHPEKGIIGPGYFVNILEKSGVLFKLDLFIWEEAARKLSEWKKQNIDMHIAVNISAKDFYHVDLFKFFTELVERYDISPSKLKLEITETVFMHDIKLHTQVLSKLQKYGFSIEMDDFGSGYSSLNMLKNLSVDILKIDMVFLKQTQNSEKTKTILGIIIQMAKKLGMTIITEGVENQESADFLTEAGCDLFQGFLYSKPVSVEEFEKKFIGGAAKC